MEFEIRHFNTRLIMQLLGSFRFPQQCGRVCRCLLLVSLISKGSHGIMQTTDPEKLYAARHLKLQVATMILVLVQYCKWEYWKGVLEFMHRPTLKTPNLGTKPDIIAKETVIIPRKSLVESLVSTG